MKLEGPMLMSEHTGVFKKRRGGGIAILFGLLFFLGGVIMMAVALGGLPAEENEDVPLALVVAVFALFVAIGLAFMLGRAGVIIDRRTEKVVSWWGLLVPFQRKEFPLNGFEKVTLKKEVRGSGKNQNTVYAVRLEGEVPNMRVEIDAPLDYLAARRLAEETAKFIQKPLADYSSGALQERSPEELDLSFREQLRRRGEKAEMPSAPMNLRTQITPLGDGVELVLPPDPLNLFLLLPVILISSIVAFMIIPIFKEEKMLHGVGLAVVFVWVIIALVGPIIIAVIYARTKKMKVTATSAGLRVEVKGVLSRRITEIPADELEELTLSSLDYLIESTASSIPGLMQEQGGETGTIRMEDGRPMPGMGFVKSFLLRTVALGITARSDRASVTFGKGLSPEELKYLHELVKGAIVK